MRELYAEFEVLVLVVRQLIERQLLCSRRFRSDNLHSLERFTL